MGDESDNDSLSPTLFKFSGVDTSVGEIVLEDELSKLLQLKATLLEIDYNDEEGTILFCCHQEEEEESCKDDHDAQVLKKLGNYIEQRTISPSPESILVEAAVSTVSIVDEEEDECVEYITEEEAYQLWLEQNQCNLDNDDENDESNLVSSPDGILMRPKHHIQIKEEKSSQGNPTTAAQLERDPGLLNFDNVERVHYDEILDYVSDPNITSANKGWKDDFGSQPLMISGFTSTSELVAFSTCLRETIRQHGAETIVRTGNRETLITNGFHNSKPANLSEAVDVQDDTEHNQNDGTIVFNPIHEMPRAFRSVLGQWIDEKNGKIFPNRLWTTLLGEETDTKRDPHRFTLCIANEGFGIGMHKHGPALFFLTQGRKKWYLSHPENIDQIIAQQQNSTDNSSSNTHPGFYQELSTHKCIQQPGEMLLVPNLWYHEIYNLASPTIGIQALADELTVPGTLLCSTKKVT
mmetsp:Transcript_18093/g.45008  ORF Transcript_18093/g.45008 Transcript_18093/m.45008 type:complete len:465 (+) Transcript_18093:1054-2448(+)